MEMQDMQVAKLDAARLARLKALEKELGTCLVALERQFRLADLTPAQLQRVQAAEKEMGVVLLAYECK